MARLIDADALKKAIMAEPWKEQINAVRLTVDYINIIIDEQPTVDAGIVGGRIDFTKAQEIMEQLVEAWNRRTDDVDTCTVLL